MKEKKEGLTKNMAKTHEVLCPECRAIMVESLPITQPDGSTSYVCSLNEGHILYVDP